MAEASRPQVTITLGRSGQVVTRTGAGLDSRVSDSVPAVGSKRSIRDRLGSNVDALQLDNKRHRGDNGRLSLKAGNGVDDVRLQKDDLRFKIMRRTQSNGSHVTVDLREMLSRPANSDVSLHPSMPESRNGRQRVPEHTSEARDDRRPMPEARDDRRRMPDPRDERQRMPDPRDDRQRMPETRDNRQRMPEARDSRLRMPDPRDDRHRISEARDIRQCMPEPVEVRQPMHKLTDGRQRLSESSNGSMPRRVTSTRASEASSQMGLLRNSYSPWTLDHIRRRSPDRVLDNSRGLSPPPPTVEQQRRPIIRTYDDPRAATYATRDVREISRPMSSASFLSKPALTGGPTKVVGSMVGPPLPPSGIVQRSRYPVEDHLTLEGFLHSLGLEKYLISFKVEEVDMATLSQMGDNDLKELGIPMGPRKKILLALLARTRRQPR